MNLLVQPTFSIDTPAGRASAYNDWRYAMGLATDRTMGLDLSRAFFDANAVYRPVTVETIEAELLALHAKAAHHERSLRDYWRIRRAVQKRHGMNRGCHACKSERQFFILKSTVGFLRGYRAEIAKLNAEVDALEEAPRVPAHVRIAAE